MKVKINLISLPRVYQSSYKPVQIKAQVFTAMDNHKHAKKFLFCPKSTVVCTADTSWWVSLVTMICQRSGVIIDFRRKQHSHSPLIINSSAVAIVSIIKFPGVQINDRPDWSLNTLTLVERAQQHLHFMCWLRRAHISLTIHPFRTSHTNTSQ